MINNEPGIGIDPHFKAEPGKFYRRQVTKNAILDGAVRVKDKPRRGIEPTRDGRLRVTGDQLDKAREEMYRDLMAPEIKPAAELLKGGFGKWLAESGDLNKLTDNDIHSLRQALDSIIDSTNARGYVGTADLGTADKVRADARVTVGNSKSKSSLLSPLTHRGRDDSYSVSMLFDESGKLKFKGNGTGLIANIETGAVTAETDKFDIESGASTNNFIPAMVENYDELLYLSEKISSLLRDNPVKNSFAKPKNILALLRGHGTRQNYPVRRFIPGGTEWIEAPLDIDCLLDRFTHARVLVGVAAAFKEATGQDTPIRHFDEKNGARELFLERWQKTPAEIDNESLRGFDEKYKWFFDSATELVDAPEEKGMEVYNRIRDEHHRRFSIRPYSGLPATPPTLT